MLTLADQDVWSSRGILPLRAGASFLEHGVETRSVARVRQQSLALSEKDEKFLKAHLDDFEFLGFLPYDDALIEADLNGASPFDVDSPSKDRVKAMISKL